MGGGSLFDEQYRGGAGALHISAEVVCIHMSS